jgi:hypothetical protein
VVELEETDVLRLEGCIVEYWNIGSERFGTFEMVSEKSSFEASIVACLGVYIKRGM